MAAASEKRRCHYEVLGIGMDSTAEEIRSAYRKLALQLHPDKLIQSGLSQSEATAKFQELSHSYEVLSDPKERSWYDSHRSKILFTTADSSSSSVVPDLFAFFSNSAFSGYSSDNKKSFFKVYSDVFNRIYANELEFARRMGGAAEDVEEAPAMGDLESPYAQAAAFYAYWTGFSTVLDFSWTEPYDAAAGENRKSRRVMEEENKKARRKARREYSETVRGLAEFVKKRDKRVIDMAVKKKEAEERRRAEERDRRKREEKERLERAMAYQEPEWAQVADDDDDDVVEEEVEEVEELYCVACGKRFKSDEQWKNHERSKKHRENVDRIRKEVVSDGEVEEDEEQKPEYKNKSEDDVFEEELEEMMRDKARIEVDEEEEEEQQQQQQKDKDEVEVEVEVEVEIDNVVEEEQEEDKKYEDEIGVLEAMLGGRRNRKKAVPLDKDNDDVMEYNDRKSTRKNRRRAKKGNNENGAKNGEEEEKEKVEEEKEKEKEKLVFEKKAINAKSEATNGSKSKASSKGKKAKGGSKNSSNNECEKCGEEFESRTKLHKHLSDTGHASLKYR